MAGLFGEFFDFNKDGKLDSFEQLSELLFLEKLEKQAREEIEEKNGENDFSEDEEDYFPEDEEEIHFFRSIDDLDEDELEALVDS